MVKDVNQESGMRGALPGGGPGGRWPQRPPLLGRHGMRTLQSALQRVQPAAVMGGACGVALVGAPSACAEGKERNARAVTRDQHAASSLRVELQALSGAVSGAIARCMVAPLDVVKIRLQVQLEPQGSGTAKYRSVLGSIATIFKEEGLVGLWRGTVPAVLFWMPYTAVQFAVLEQCNAALAAENSPFSHWDSSAKQFVGGSVAGVAATVTSYPLDLIRTNFAAQGEPRVYSSIAGAAWGIARQRGVTGLYAGMGATLLEIIPHSGLQFAAYDLFKRAALGLHRQEETGGVRTAAGGLTEGAEGSSSSTATLTVREKFVCGLLAGSLAKSAIHPLDVVKKRFQVAGLRRSSTYGARVGAVEYKGLVDAFTKIHAREGVRGLYKGLAPNLLKAAPSSAITLVLYEYITSRIRWRLTSHTV